MDQNQPIMNQVPVSTPMMTPQSAYQVPSEPAHHNSPKYAFLYLLSFGTLNIIAFAVGSIFFSLIEKYIGTPNVYYGYFSPSTVKFGIASLLVGSPVYYLTTHFIRKGLINGDISLRAGLRRWLTYLLLLSAILTIIGSLIGVIFNFLNGDMTAKFTLQMLTVIAIAGIILGYYLYDISRKEIVAHDKFVIGFFGFSIFLVIISIIFGFIVVGSPVSAQKLKSDADITSELSNVNNAIVRYADKNKKMPENLDVLMSKYDSYSQPLTADQLTNNKTNTKYDYSIVSTLDGLVTYKLCTDFQTNSSDKNDQSFFYDYEASNSWVHAAGHACFTKTYKLPLVDKPVYNFNTSITGTWSNCVSLDNFSSCSEYCQSINKICDDGTAITSRGAVGFGAEAWSSAQDCQSGISAGGQTQCSAQDTNGGARWKCFCR